jgi:FtsP/CotA-like multicopper oxidase with cupredoxin domain
MKVVSMKSVRRIPVRLLAALIVVLAGLAALSGSALTGVGEAAPAAGPAVSFAATDATKVPHYFGPFSNWANSPQVLGDALLTISPAAGDTTGKGATATATVDPKTGAISAVTITDPGTGYAAAPTVTVDSPGITPTTPAQLDTTISLGVLSSITVAEKGFGFVQPQVTLTGGNPTTPATAIASGAVDNLALSNVDAATGEAGTCYVHPIAVIDAPDPTIVGGRQATATVAVSATGGVTGVTVVDGGAGYTKAPGLTIAEGAVSGAVNPNAPPQCATSAPGVIATATSSIDVSQIDVLTGGEGYDTAPTITIGDIVDAANPTNPAIDRGATATATVATKGAVSAIAITAAGAGYLTPGIKKFIDTLPGLGPNAANNYGAYIPVAVPDTTTYPGTDYYEIAVVQYRQKFASDLPPTLMRGYVQLSTTKVPGKHVPLGNANLDPSVAPTPIAGFTGVDDPHYLGPTILATKNRPVRILFRNLLPTGVAGDLFLPVDTTLMGAGTGSNSMPLDANGVPVDMAQDTGSVLDGVRNPECGLTPKPPTCFSENRATLHLHGGITPWISDGTPHQWTTPANENTAYPKGVSVSNVPDMPAPGPGAETFFYTNQQSARLMFYHDHAWGITRLNVYAGEAAGYDITDPTEQALIAPGGALDGLGIGTPLIIQDKTFVSKDVHATDPTWDTAKWGGEGNLWAPHVYMPAQNPADPTGMSPFGRWMYGPWFWPPAKDAKYPPMANPYYHSCDPASPTCTPAESTTCDPNAATFCEPPQIPSTPNVSVGMEAFNDTPIVNGTAYPTTPVDPKAYRFRILNAANDRFWNLQWYVADPTTGTLSEVALKPSEVQAAQTDPNVFPTPDTTKSPAGPDWIQIGSEGGFLPSPTVVSGSQPMTWITDPTRFDVGNADKHSLLLAPAERADVIVDFSRFRGKTLILYNDAPAAFPARVSSYDYYTGGPDLSPVGAPTTLPGYGPNTRTIMQVKVSSAAPALAFDRPNTTADRMGTLEAAFAHHLDASGKPAGVFESGSNPIVVGQVEYNKAYGTDFVGTGNCNDKKAPTARCDGHARIFEMGGDSQIQSTPGDQFHFDTLAGAQHRLDPTHYPDAAPSQLSLELRGKGMHDEMNSASFDEWGRMTANLGLEAPGATPLLQNIILYPYVNPPTELLDATDLPSSIKVTPISSSADGTQIWKLTHNGVDTHPIHFHLYDVQVLNRVTWDNIVMAPDPNELGWKDTVRVSPLEDTIVAVRPIIPTLPFGLPDSKHLLNPSMPEHAKGAINGPNGTEAGFNNTDPNGNPVDPISNEIFNFGWEYVVHCHILSHEEMDMMRPVTVHVPRAPADAPVLSFTRAPGQVVLNWTDGTPVDYANPATWLDAAGKYNARSEIGYRIERAEVTNGNAGAFTEIGVGAGLANVITYTDSPPDPTTTYRYVVTAYNAAGDSASNTITVVGVPTAPTGLTATVQPDTTQPAGATVRLDWVNNATNADTITVERTDAAGTVVILTATLVAGNGGAGQSFTDSTITAPGTYSYRVWAVNVIGPSAPAGPVSATIALPASSTVLTSSKNPSVFGEQVTFTATVGHPASSLAPTGTVVFSGPGVTLAVPVDPTTGIAQVSMASLPVGADSVTAAYGGDSMHATSTDTLVQNVDRSVSTTVVAGSPNPSTLGQSVTFTATVTPVTGTTAPTGSVLFSYSVGGVPVTRTSSLAAGSATLVTGSLPAGTTTVTAQYLGDATVAPSTATVDQVVNQITTTTVVTSSFNPSRFGSMVTFTGTVTGAVAGPAISGGVTFTIDGTTYPAAIAGGVATVALDTLAQGTHQVTAAYGGDVDYAASTSAPITQTVGPRLVPTTTAVVSSLNPSVFGNAVSFTATVTGTGGVPGGTISWNVDGTPVGGAIALDAAGTAGGLNTATLGAGNHQVTATYSGDAAFAGSATTLVQVVNAAPTTTAIARSRRTSVYGQAVTFTATVAPAAANGTVQFAVNGAPAGAPVAVVAGQAAITITTLPVGNPTVTATFTGSPNAAGVANHASSTSTALTQAVARAATTTALATSGSPAAVRTAVTFRATVRPVAPGAGVPTGSVRFRVNGRTVATIALNASGVAAYPTTFARAATYRISAVYVTSPSYSTSTSASINQVIR